MPLANVMNWVLLNTQGGVQIVAGPRGPVETELKRGESGKTQGYINGALNQIENGNGKATGALVMDRNPVLHASAGSGEGGQSVTIFYYQTGQTATIFAVGEHIDSQATRYRIGKDYYRAGDANFGKGRVI